MSRPEVSDVKWKLLNEGNPEEEQEAFEDIVIHYQYLVEGTARKLQRKLPSFLEDSELISLGQMGLIKAVRRYKPEQGPFSRYASTVVYGAIIDGLRASDFAPRGLRRKQRDMESAIQELRNLGVSKPTNYQISVEMGVDESEVRQLHQKILRAEVSPEDPVQMMSAQESVSMLTRELTREFVAWLKKQPKVTQKIVALRYWESKSIKQVSERLGVPAEQVRIRHMEALSAILQLMKDLASDE